MPTLREWQGMSAMVFVPSSDPVKCLITACKRQFRHSADVLCMASVEQQLFM